MKYGKQAGLATILTSTLLGLGLQGCLSTSVVKKNQATSFPQVSDAETSRLFKQGVSANLRLASAYLPYVSPKADAMGFSTITKKPIPVSQSPFLRQAILSTSRGKVLTACQFPVFRIELDGKKETADWLVTTKGKGARCAAESRYFWIIQQSKSSPAEILLAGRGSFVEISKPKGTGWSELEIRDSSMIAIKSGDKLADGSWVQVPSKDKSRVQIDCRSKFRLQGKRYQSYAESVEANVVSLPHPGKTWQPVKDPRYRCSF